jgi:hypothetical protein
MDEPPKIVKELAKMVGGTIEDSGRLPDGSGFATMSMPLPKDHWLTKPGLEPPPMPFRMREGPTRQEWVEKISAAGKYAVRASTMNGTDNDFDPDAMLQNLVVGMIGYHTEDGLSSLDDWMNPKPVPPLYGDANG